MIRIFKNKMFIPTRNLLYNSIRTNSNCRLNQACYLLVVEAIDTH